MRTALFFLLFLFLLPFPIRAQTSTAGRDIAVFFSNDIHGKTEPCG